MLGAAGVHELRLGDLVPPGFVSGLSSVRQAVSLDRTPIEDIVRMIVLLNERF